MAVTDDVQKVRQRIVDKKCAAANKEKLAAKRKVYYAANKENFAAKKKAYRAANKEQVRISQKKYEAANKEALAVKNKARYEKNRSQVLVWQKEYRQKNKEVRQANMKAYRLANQAYLTAYQRARRAQKKAIAAGKIPPPPMPNIADFRAQHEASGSVVPATSTDTAPELLPEEDHPLAATTKKIVMVSFTNEHPFNLRKRGPEPCCDECALFQPNALTSATNTVLLAGTYMCTFCRDWTYYRLHRKLKRTRADARLDALTA